MPVVEGHERARDQHWNHVRSGKEGVEHNQVQAQARSSEATSTVECRVDVEGREEVVTNAYTKVRMLSIG